MLEFSSSLSGTDTGYPLRARENTLQHLPSTEASAHLRGAEGLACVSVFNPCREVRTVTHAARPWGVWLGVHALHLRGSGPGKAKTHSPACSGVGPDGPPPSGEPGAFPTPRLSAVVSEQAREAKRGLADLISGPTTRFLK